ncbi:MAG: hypothetical protein KDA96_26180, partial [Planctomycetaceae bacterium]|nr:hypothetical protein [Planctomycetaceae bacterium]
MTAIRIEGNKTIPEAEILPRIQTQLNRPLNDRQVAADKRALYSTRWFFDVRERIDETPEGIVLVFEVRERPIVQRVEFIGNNSRDLIGRRNVSRKQLEAWTGLKVGSPFDHVANQHAVQRIEREYKEKGFYFARVELEKGSNPGEREVVFRITEGPKVRVLRRTFEGNQFWGDGDLKKNLQTKAAMLGFIGGLYRDETIPQDVDALKQFYRNVGYFDVEVEATPLFSPSKGYVDLHFTINEGIRSRVREIQFEGNYAIPEAALRDGSRMRSGEYFNATLLGKDIRRMQGYYNELGHLFASIRPVPTFTEQPGVVDLVLEIDEDRPRYYRNIDVAYDGDYPHTKHTVVLDRLGISPGQLANADLLRRGRSRIAGSGLFEPGVTVTPTPVDPEHESFAAVTQTFRGQGPGTGSHSDHWTDRFVETTQRQASRSVVSYKSLMTNPESEIEVPEAVPPTRRPAPKTQRQDEILLQNPPMENPVRTQASGVNAHTINAHTINTNANRINGGSVNGQTTHVKEHAADGPDASLFHEALGQTITAVFNRRERDFLTPLQQDPTAVLNLTEPSASSADSLAAATGPDEGETI